MKRSLILIALAATLSSGRAVLAQEGADSTAPQPSGLLRNEPGAAPGYTLFAPLRSKSTYLVDMEGEVAHSWTSELRPGNSVYLLENGSLLRCAREPDNPVFSGGGQGGRIQEIAPDGKLLWDFVYSSEEHLHHHDIEPMPNGNVLLIAWEQKTQREAVRAGRDRELLESETFWPDFVIEVRPERPTGGEIVWEWHAFDHLIQDMDPDRANFGVVAEHPERIDINGDRRGTRPSPEDVAKRRAEEERLRALGYAGDDDEDDDDDPRGRGRRGGADWMHTNSIDYNAELDQIVISVRGMSEFWILDHGTTTAEAAGSAGDLLYRWGNPKAYGRGAAQDQRLFVQHDVQWIPAGAPGAGNILVFNNGGGRAGGDYSSVDELALPVDEDGRYTIAEGAPFAPESPVWSYVAEERTSFYAGHISGAQRLPNGNTLVCDGEKGRFFELAPEGQIVWEYVNPFGEVDAPEGGRGGPPRGEGSREGPRAGGRGEGRGGPPGRPPGAGGNRGGPGSPRAVYRATRIAPDHPGLEHLGLKSR